MIVCACVLYECVCVFLRGSVFASKALVVVSIDGLVSDQLQLLFDQFS